LAAPSNLGIIVWMVVGSVAWLGKSNRQWLKASLPSPGLMAYLLLSIASISFASDKGKAIAAAGKLALAYVGGFTLMGVAITSIRRLEILCTVGAVAAALAVLCCLGGRYLLHGVWGFHGNAHKYGTYIGMVIPAATVFLLTSPRNVLRIFGWLLPAGGLLSAGSLGAMAAIPAGVGAAILLVPRWRHRLAMLMATALAGLAVTCAWASPVLGRVRQDLALYENDLVNLRQRYIEWQAELNLLDWRVGVGTGIGCLNSYRSSGYGRLPKLNTLEAFDQNGWLLIAAETGILALVFFVQGIVHYGQLGYRQIRVGHDESNTGRWRCATAALAGLVGASVANVFSSVHFNGNITVFVLLLAMIPAIANLPRER
jgi:hypothetical protein